MTTQEEQIRKIQLIMGKDEIPHYKFTFGKHIGKTLKYVADHEIGYIRWALLNMDERDLGIKVREMLNRALELKGHEQID